MKYGIGYWGTVWPLASGLAGNLVLLGWFLSKLAECL